MQINVRDWREERKKRNVRKISSDLAHQFDLNENYVRLRKKKTVTPP